MYSERGVRARSRLGVDGFKILWTERVIPHRRGRIAGVTRAGPIIAGEKFFAYM